jgi:hypothetical protein
MWILYTTDKQAPNILFCLPKRTVWVLMAPIMRSLNPTPSPNATNAAHRVTAGSATGQFRLIFPYSGQSSQFMVPVPSPDLFRLLQVSQPPPPLAYMPPTPSLAPTPQPVAYPLQAPPPTSPAVASNMLLCYISGNGMPLCSSACAFCVGACARVRVCLNPDEGFLILGKVTLFGMHTRTLLGPIPVIAKSHSNYGCPICL